MKLGQIPYFQCAEQWLNGARHAGDLPAVLSPGKEAMTYDGLHGQIRNTASWFNDNGIGRGHCVGIVLPSGANMATAFLAVSAITRSAPLNPDYSAPEFEFYLDDLEAKAVVVMENMDSPVREVASKRDIPVIELHPSADNIAGAFTLSGSPAGRNCRGGWNGPEDISLLLHTSGTTSRPKMVPLSQKNIFTSACNVGKVLSLCPEDRCLNVMPLFHIHGLVACLMATVNSGGSVVCTPGFSGSEFMDWLWDYQATWYSAVPTIHQAVLAAAGKHDFEAKKPALRFIRSSSASLAPSVMSRMEEVFGVPVIESYGMTEAAHQMTSNQLPPGRRKPGTVGVAAGPEVAVMDEEKNLLPTGQIGEIVISGPSVTGGYVNNQEANASSFTGAWFHTGDQGCIDADGFLTITGRLKELINRGGEKIAPREIDEILMGHPAVAQAVAFGVPHVRLGEAVVAAAVLETGGSASELELRQYCARHLVPFKVPQQIVFLEEIPKGATGKLQRIGLAEKLACHLSPPFEEPRSYAELQLSEIWEEVLGVNPVGRADNFFNLGGDSIQATRVITRLNEFSGVEFPLSLLFEYPRLSELAEQVEAAAPVDPDELEKLLSEIEDLPDASCGE